MKISIIVPIYNVGKYLEKCIESVAKQTYDDLDIVLVDDGSTDGSAAICDRFAEKYHNIKALHKSNGGVSDARNVGIKAASGDYITFLDGDDYWDDSNAAKRLADRLKKTNVDVLNYSYKKCYDGTEEQILYFSGVADMPVETATSKEAIEYLTERGLYIASPCNKIMRRSLLAEDLLFQKGVYSEDIAWCGKLLLRAKTMDFICENFYCYRQHGASNTHTTNKKKCNDLCDNIIDCLKLGKEQTNQTRRDCMYRYTAYQYGTFFVTQARSDEVPSESIQRLKEYSWILKYHVGNRKLKALRLCCIAIGFENTCRLIRKLSCK